MKGYRLWVIGYRRALLDPFLALGFVSCQLLLQGLQRVKLLFFAKVMQQLEGQSLTVEVAIEIEDMHFDASLPTVMKGGASTHIEPAEES